MVPPELQNVYNILTSFLGRSKNPLDDTLQVQWPCPRCIEREGIKELRKYNLECNLAEGIFNCWSCSASDNDMHGTIPKLIRNYGSPLLLQQYREQISMMKKSQLYVLKYGITNFDGEVKDVEMLKLPKGYTPFEKSAQPNLQPLQYLLQRGIDWDIIEQFHMGYTPYSAEDKRLSNRIILPSHNKFGELNYWTGRDFTGNDKRQKYYNPTVERKEIIFDENQIQYDADITLVEGPFDHIVVPNSVPLLGKVLNANFVLFHEINEKANANINIFLDGDAVSAAKNLYKTLNQGRLYGKVRIIDLPVNLDPSEIFQKWGRKGIIRALSRARKLTNLELL